MKNLKTKKLNTSLLSQIIGACFKVSVICLFLLVFIGAINPARISERMGKDVSLFKSAFYFKSFTSQIVALDSEEDNVDNSLIDDPFAAMNESGEVNYDDLYANFFAMSANDDFGGDSDFDDEDFDDDGPLEYAAAEKIVIPDYKALWGEFRENHPEIAEVINFDRTASILTFLAIILSLCGIYLTYGSKKLRKAGYIVSAVGAVLVIVSLAGFTKAYNQLNDINYNVDTSIDVMAFKGPGAKIFIIFSVIVILLAALSFVCEKLFSKNEIETEKRGLQAAPFQYTYRILALLLFVLLFIPGANPARISENINRNVSLFTSGFSYRTYTENLGKELLRGWLPYSVVNWGHYSSLIVCLGIIACAAGACMSVGNNKLKRYGHFALFGGGAVSFAGMFGIIHSYNLISSSQHIDKLLPLQPGSVGLYLVLLPLILICTAVSFLKTPSPEKDEKCHIDAPYQLFLMLLPFLILVFIFSYLPLWGWRYAFFDYNAGDTITLDKWVGFKYFKLPFESLQTGKDILQVIRNTLVMSGLGILFSWLPMIFAIFLTEIRNTKTRKIIQTLTTIPNFISWVLVYAIAFCIFGTEGFISNFFVNKGIWAQGRNMLMNSVSREMPKWVDGWAKFVHSTPVEVWERRKSFIQAFRPWIQMWAWGTWKGLGWSAIMYIAAISGIDQQLYEAATVDGAGRFQKIRHITIPELFPTYMVLLILSVSNILSNGMDQYLVFKNTTNKDSLNVLDLYVYSLSFGTATNNNIPFSTVVSMLKSLVSVLLLFITNKISKWIRGTSIF